MRKRREKTKKTKRMNLKKKNEKKREERRKRKRTEKRERSGFAIRYPPLKKRILYMRKSRCESLRRGGQGTGREAVH